MSRCFTLGRRGLGRVSPNPPVGAVLVHEGRILSEGYHSHYGGPHAEVEAIRNVAKEEKHLIPASTLYVSLEPCCITGKTPPCTSLIISESIKDVRVSTKDPNPEMAGKGLDILRMAGITVTENILAEEGKYLIRSFTTNILLHRPHILLKWAQSHHGYAGKSGEQIWLSDPLTKTWSHGQRAIVDAIMVGARTVETDNPSLTTRHYPGKSAHRVVYDPNGRLAQHYKVFNDDGQNVYYFSAVANEHISGAHIHKTVLDTTADDLRQIINHLHHFKIGILLVEGGAYLQKKFIQQNLWDEAWVIRSKHPLNEGIRAPEVKGHLIAKEKIESDMLLGIQNTAG